MRLAALLFASLLVSRDAGLDIEQGSARNRVMIVTVQDVSGEIHGKNERASSEDLADRFEKLLNRIGAKGWRLCSLTGDDLVFRWERGEVSYRVSVESPWNQAWTRRVEAERKAFEAKVGKDSGLGWAPDQEAFAEKRREVADEAFEDLAKDGWYLGCQYRRLGEAQPYILVK